jgi:hypothetical protein
MADEAHPRKKLDPSTNKIVVGENYSSFELYACNQ